MENYHWGKERPRAGMLKGNFIGAGLNISNNLEFSNYKVNFQFYK
jgi:hypothetical protein